MKPKTAAKALRKRPIQARSRATVVALIEAAAQVLASRGYEGATTDSIAERAGVSIGTLYQYFPNKDALIADLVRRHVDELVETVRAALARSDGSSPEDMLRALIRAAIDAHRINPKLHRVLAEQVPREAYPAEAGDVSSRLRSMIERRMRETSFDLSPQRLRTIAFVIESVIETLTHRAVIDAQDWLTCGALEREGVELLGPYLARALRGRTTNRSPVR